MLLLCLGCIYIVYAYLALRFFAVLINEKLEFTLRPDIDLPDKWRPFHRYDRSNWRLWEIYLGAITFLPLRILSIMFLYLIAFIVVSCLGIGTSYEQEWPSYRYRFLKAFIKGIVRVKLFISGFYTVPKHLVQYADYELQAKVDRTSPPTIIVSNHVSWWDSFILLQVELPSFLAKEEIRRMPVVGYFATMFKSIYVQRNQKVNRDSVLDSLRERCQLIAKGKVFPPVCIFPEATTTNGKYLLPFKRGAFEQALPLKLVCLRYHDGHFNLALDNVGMSGVLIALTQFRNRVEIFEFDGLYDPPYLKDDAVPYDDKWKRFADDTRSIMAKCLKAKETTATSLDTWDYHFHLFPNLKHKME